MEKGTAAKITAEPDVSPALLTAQETAQITNRAVSTIYAMMKEKQLPVVRLGRSVRVHRAKLMRMLDELAEGGNQ